MTLSWPCQTYIVTDSNRVHISLTTTCVFLSFFIYLFILAVDYHICWPQLLTAITFDHENRDTNCPDGQTWLRSIGSVTSDHLMTIVLTPCVWSVWEWSSQLCMCSDRSAWPLSIDGSCLTFWPLSVTTLIHCVRGCLFDRCSPASQMSLWLYNTTLRWCFTIDHRSCPHIIKEGHITNKR